MKIKKSKLTQIIQEELTSALRELSGKVTPVNLPKEEEPWHLKFLSKQAKEDWRKPGEVDKAHKGIECDQDGQCPDETGTKCGPC
jgi:hypothetical protein